MKTKLIVARSWRKFNKQQIVAIQNLTEKLKDHFSLEFYLCINDLTDSDQYLEDLDDIPGAIVSIISTEELDKYAKKNRASDAQIAKFGRWKWIYHLILYHYLYHEKKMDYILSYDDDIFFNGEILEAVHFLKNEIPFAIEDQHADGDKCMFGKLVEYFGPWVVDEYYSCYASGKSSNSGFMGLSLRKIFSNFAPGVEFLQMLEMFEYRPYIHDSKVKVWKDYKILLQEQSFLGILSRATSGNTHIVLEHKDGYSIADIEKSKVQHYVATKKYESDFLKRVSDTYMKLKFKRK
jgi:hypothetical protein